MAAIESDPTNDPAQLPVPALNTLYLGMSNNKRTAGSLYLISYILRRAVFAVVVVLMQDYPALQV